MGEVLYRLITLFVLSLSISLSLYTLHVEHQLKVHQRSQEAGQLQTDSYLKEFQKRYEEYAEAAREAALHTPSHLPVTPPPRTKEPGATPFASAKGAPHARFYRPKCDLHAHFSCSSALKSPYAALSQFIGIPFTDYYLPPVSNALLGVLFYVVELGMCMHPVWMWRLATLGVLSTFVLGFIMVVVMREVCPVCLSIYVLNSIMYIVSFFRVREYRIVLRRRQREAEERYQAKNGGGDAALLPSAKKIKGE